MKIQLELAQKLSVSLWSQCPGVTGESKCGHIMSDPRYNLILNPPLPHRYTDRWRSISLSYWTTLSSQQAAPVLIVLMKEFYWEQTHWIPHTSFTSTTAKMNLYQQATGYCWCSNWMGTCWSWHLTTIPQVLLCQGHWTKAWGCLTSLSATLSWWTEWWG